MRQVLLLAEELITDVAAWGEEMDCLDGDPSISTDGAWAEMNRQGRVLAARLPAEVGSRLTIEYRPR